MHCLPLRVGDPPLFGPSQGALLALFDPVLEARLALHLQIRRLQGQQLPII